MADGLSWDKKIAAIGIIVTAIITIMTALFGTAIFGPAVNNLLYPKYPAINSTFLLTSQSPYSADISWQSGQDYQIVLSTNDTPVLFQIYNRTSFYLGGGPLYQARSAYALSFPYKPVENGEYTVALFTTEGHPYVKVYLRVEAQSLHISNYITPRKLISEYIKAWNRGDPHQAFAYLSNEAMTVNSIASIQNTMVGIGEGYELIGWNINELTVEDSTAYGNVTMTFEGKSGDSAGRRYDQIWTVYLIKENGYWKLSTPFRGNSGVARNEIINFYLDLYGSEPSDSELMNIQSNVTSGFSIKEAIQMSNRFNNEKPPIILFPTFLSKPLIRG